MKKLRNSLLFLVVIFTLIFTASCDGSNNNTGANNSSVDNSGKAMFTLVISDDTPYEPITYFARRITEKCGISTTIKRYSPDEIYTVNTVFIGEMPFNLSRNAYKALSRLDTDKKEDVRYVVRCNDGAVAIAFDTDKYDVWAGLYTAIDYTVDNVILADGTVPRTTHGNVAEGYVNTIDYQRAQDEILREEQFDNLYEQILAKVDNSEALATQIYQSIRNIYNLYSPDMVSWFANLWDPVSGGFYFSNSGRDTLGFLPDIESTAQMMDILIGSGLTTYGNMPEWFTSKMIAFVKGLQDPNGYFYHPQWTREMTDNNTQRRSRDLSKAMGFFNRFGVKPTYDTPTGVKGDGILADGTPVSEVHLTSKLINGTSLEVSKVIATASFDYKASYLENAGVFREWLDTIPINATSYDSYYYGNALCTVCAEIVARDKVLVSQGQPGLIDVVAQWLGEKQNPQTGCWSPTFDVDAINGLFKILSFYGGIKRPLPNAEAALTSTINMLNIITPQDVIRVCDIFNIWCNLDMIKENVNLYGTSAEKQVVVDFYSTLLKNSATGMKNSAEILSLFVRDDGSMSYNPAGTCPTSQGMPVAINGACEGDVNGCAMGTVGTLPPLLQLLGLSGPTIFMRGDEIEFYSILEDLGEIVKDPMVVGTSDGFENYEEGDEYPRVSYKDFPSGGGYSIVEREDGKGKALLYSTQNGGFDNLYISCDSEMLSATCYVFEADLFLRTNDIGAVIQLAMDEDQFLNICGNDTDGDGIMDAVGLYEQSTNDSSKWILNRMGSVAKLEEWFNLRIEYYPGNAEDVRIITYVNGEVMAVTDDYWGKTVDGGKTPLTRYNYVRIMAPSTKTADLYIDNLLVTKTMDTYEPYGVSEGDPAFGYVAYNIDSPVRDELVYDFDSADDLRDFIQRGNIALNNGALVATGSGAGITLPFNVRGAKTNCTVIESDITVSSNSAVGTTYEILARDFLNFAVARLYVRVENRNGVPTVVLAEASQGKLGEYIKDVELPIGEKFKLGLAYYKQEGVILVYVNDKLVASTNKLCPSARDYRVHNLEVNVVTSTVSSATLTLDNLKAERIVSDFAKATAPTLDEKVYVFDGDMPEDITFNGSFTTHNGKLSLESANSGDYFIIPVNRRSDTGESVIFLTDLDFREGVADSSGFRIALVDNSGKTAVEFFVFTRNGVTYVYESTETKTYETPIASFKNGKISTLSIEYYPDSHITEILLDGAVVGRTSLNYEYNEQYGTIDYVKITSAGASSFLLNNIRAEKYNKLYMKTDIKVTNEENGSETLGFETSFTNNVPVVLTHKFYTPGAAVRIREHSVYGEVNKVLEYATSPGGNDELRIGLTKKDTALNAVAFETDMFLDMKSTSDVFSIYFELGNNHVTRVTFKYMADGTVMIYDDMGTNNFRIYHNAGEWFKLRLEYSVTDIDYNGDGQIDALLRVFINGELKATGYKNENLSYTANRINYMLIYSHSAANFSTYFDNMKFEHFDLNVAPHEHTYSDGYTYDEKNHWHKSTCSAFDSCSSVTTEKTAHEFDADGFCECGYEKHVHKYSSDWSYDNDAHWHAPICSGTSECAGLKADYALHEYDELGFCSCGYQKHIHEYSDKWVYNQNYHWHKATCKVEGECRDAISDKAPHEYDENGECMCGHTKVELPTGESDIVTNPDGWTEP